MTNSPTSILIVDDEESIRLSFEMFLEREGYGPITTVATLDEALIAIKSGPFDLIISDIVLGDRNGTDLLREIKALGITCPVVMITGFPNLDTAAEAVRFGAFDYISKPVNKASLLRFTRQALKHWELEKEKQQLQQENEKYRQYLETIFSSVTDAIITIDRNMNITQLNETARQWMKDNGITNIDNLDKLPGDMGLACFNDARLVLEQKCDVREHQVECPKSDGTIRVMSLNAAPLKDAAQQFHGAVIVARDITQPRPEDDSQARNRFHGYVGASPAMQQVYRLIEHVGKVDTSVLVTGESGTGKELAAEALHAESSRRDKTLVKVDCAAVTESLLESELFGHRKGAFTGADRDRPGKIFLADKGTLFLDEIGDISPRMQLRLLRFLQEKTFTPVGQDTSIQVDVRVIAATNADLLAKVRAGLFREDLYYRLKVVEITLPPLRKRQGGIPLLANHFLIVFRDKLNKQINHISDQSMQALSSYTWPGNVRELRHVMERACILCQGPTLSMEHFPQEIHPLNTNQQTPPTRTTPPSFPDSPSIEIESEEDEIQTALKRCRGNKTKAARLLGMDRSTLYRKIKRYNLDHLLNLPRQ